MAKKQAAPTAAQFNAAKKRIRDLEALLEDSQAALAEALSKVEEY